MRRELRHLGRMTTNSDVSLGAAVVVREGGCHCGRVRFRVTLPSEARASVSECNCSICTKKGYLHLIVERSQFELICGEGELSEYRFNTGVARHLFCRTCGIHSFYVPRSHPDGYSVNARCLDGFDVSSFDRREFDGRNWEQAMIARGWRSTEG